MNDEIDTTPAAVWKSSTDSFWKFLPWRRGFFFLSFQISITSASTAPGVTADDLRDLSAKSQIILRSRLMNG